MKDLALDLYPLVTHLSPRFGYPYGEAVWTPDLWRAVREYFMNDVTDDFYTAVLDNLEHQVPEGPRLEQVEAIIATNDFWSVGNATHWAAVATAPTLKQLVRALLEENGTFEYEAVGCWFEAHATYDQRIAVARKLDPTQSQFPAEDERGELDIVLWLVDRQPSPEKILMAWNAVLNEARPAGPVPPEVIRTWAKSHGHQVGNRGRLPEKVVAAYQTAHTVPAVAV